MIHVDLPATYCVKTVLIPSFSATYFPAFELNTERYSVSLCIHPNAGKHRPEKFRIRTLFTQWLLFGTCGNGEIRPFQNLDKSFSKQLASCFQKKIIKSLWKIFQIYFRGESQYLIRSCLKVVIISPIIAWKVSKYGVISGPYFPVFGLNTGKYGPEISPYLDTFHALVAITKF